RAFPGGGLMLELRGVDAGYGATTVVRGEDLVVPDGSVVALLGPNGAGKTTLLKIGSALLTPQAGTLLFDGRDVTGASPETLVRLAKEGCSLLVVEQYVEKALAFADYVYILSRGSVQFAGDPDELDVADVFGKYLGIDVGDHAA